MHLVIARHACEVWCEICERILIALDIRAVIVILEISMLYTILAWSSGRWGIRLGKIYTLWLCAYFKKSQRHPYLIYRAVESQISTLLLDWFPLELDMVCIPVGHTKIHFLQTKHCWKSFWLISIQYWKGWK